jgi:hypothetical protein
VFEAAASVVAGGGGRFEVDFEADLAFLPRCDGVMVAGPSLSLGMVILDGKQDDQRGSRTDDDGALKVRLFSLRVRITKNRMTFRFRFVSRD